MTYEAQQGRRPQPPQWRPRPEDGKDEIWTLQMMADYLKVPLATCRKWIVEGKGPNTFRAGKWRRVRKYEVLRWVWTQEQREWI